MPRVVNFSKHGGPNVLRLETESPADPSAGEVRVRMSAIALNRSNAMFRAGTYLFEATFPSRICSEGVGIIDAIGIDVTDWKVDQRVNLLPPENESTGGYAAEFVIVDQDRLLPAPEGFNDRLAATAWVPFLTLYHLFVEQKQAAAGRWIVLPAASSSVALAANSLAHYLGAKTVGITRTRDKQALLQAAGYDALVVSEEEEVAERIVRITSGGADFIFDPVGGPMLRELVASAKWGAEINIYGALDPSITPLPIFALMESGAKISCYTVFELLNDEERLRAAVDFFLTLFDKGLLAPVADDHEFSLDQIGDAFRYMESSTQFGKVTVTV